MKTDRRNPLYQSLRRRTDTARLNQISGGGDVAKHDHEYDLVQWFDLDEAVDRLSYPNEAEMVRRAREMLLGSAAGRGEGEARPAG